MLLWQPCKLLGLYKATFSAEDSLNTLCIISVTLVKLQNLRTSDIIFLVSHFECVLKRKKKQLRAFTTDIVTGLLYVLCKCSCVEILADSV